MSGAVLQKIKDIESELSKTQRNKATEYHIGLLKGKLAKYRSMLLEPNSKSGKPGDGFDVSKSGDARVVLIGFPSVGKSTLLTTVTETESIAADYEFTTLTAVPGKISYGGANIQLVDLPGIIEGAASGKGRGKQVVSVAKTADLILIMLDATKVGHHKEILERELHSVGLRLNQQRPNIYFKVKKGGGISFNSTCKLTHLNERLVSAVLREYKIHNAEVLIREDCTIDDFLDTVIGTRKYVNALYCYNKIDAISLEEVEKLVSEPHSVVISTTQRINLDGLVESIWSHLDLTRVYTKKRGEWPDFEGGIILRRGHTSVADLCNRIHRGLSADFKYALCWGSSSKHNPQRVGLTHVLEDEDVVQIVKK
jgi:small GTP-binding protein